jgi:uncharacterized LabA/DUF88 family protein
VVTPHVILGLIFPAVRALPALAGIILPVQRVFALPDRVVVFLDYQNVYRGARRTFHAADDLYWCGQVDPLRLARHIVADSPFDRELAQVRVYRGQPSGKFDPKGYGAARRQVAAWHTSPLVQTVTRPLRYPERWPHGSPPGDRPQEKGIDVALTLDFVVMALRGEYDVGVLFSTDTDLKPALEFVADLTNLNGTPRAEVAAWSGRGQHNKRLAIKTRNLYCHWIGESTYQAVADHTDYTKS